jgi:homogentisate 1,2-dioxygenase
MVIGSISFDHPDPSIFTVLTSPSDTPGTANCDFVIFPPRWMVMRRHLPPALVPPQRDERIHGPGARPVRRQARGLQARRHEPAQRMVPHGPDAEAFDKASHAALAPHKLDHTLAFMFESRWRFKPTDFAHERRCAGRATPPAGQGWQDQLLNR